MKIMSLESPNADRPMYPRPVHPSTAPNVLLNPTDSDIRNGIWGSWYWFAKCTGTMFTVSPGAPKFVTFLSNLPNIVSILVFVVRSAYLLYVMMKSKSLSLFWSYSTIVFFVSLHSMVSAIMLYVYKTNPFVPKFIRFIRKASLNRIVRVKKSTLLRCVITVATFVAPAVVYVVECFNRYSSKDKKFEKFDTYYGDNSTQQNSLYGDVNALYVVDAVVVIWGSILSAAAMVIYLLANSALCREYALFNQELTAYIKDGSIMRLATIKSFQSQLIEYLNIAWYLNNISNSIVNLTFMAGIMAQIAAQFALYSFSGHMTSAQATLFGVWTAYSFILLIYSLKKPSNLHNMLTETKNRIWLDQGIWSKCSDPEVHNVARNIADRIGAVDYASKGLTSASAANFVFNAVLIVIPFFVDILGGYKYIDSNTPQN